MRLLSYLMIILAFLHNSTIASIRIVGGKDANIADWPWMVLIADKTGGPLKKRQFCGGTLIHPSWVLTAGHCIKDETTYSIEVITGITNLATETGVERIDVERIIPHPDYKNDDDSIPPVADIALLKLAHPSTQPIITIADQYNLLTKVDTSATVLGWGKLQESGNSYPDNLQQATVPIVSRATCNALESFNGDVQTDKLCAGFMVGGIDACTGDSGGPLVVLEGDRWKQVGIVSFGEGCARPFLYGVYTNVSFFQDFITQQICDSEEIPTPDLQVSVIGQQATAEWNLLDTIESYQLYYAPYSSPLDKVTLNNIHSFSTYLETSYTADLPKNSEYYVAIRAYRGNCHSSFSNLGTLLVH